MLRPLFSHAAPGLVAGLLFGVGLLVSGMANPAKVLNFLDVLGHWDPSLAFVMAGAVACTVVGYPLVQRKSHPVFSTSFDMPTRRDIDKQLVVGAMLFGFGWGVSGYCPGPLWTSLAGLAPGTFVFAAFMLVGMWGASKWKQQALT
ncbi:MAG: DUF6691 family protein [Granulosicoccus sp.]